MGRSDRNIQFFGEAGQRKIGAAKIAFVGVGGLGTHACQQSAYLGVGEIRLIDYEDLELTNLNRYVGAHASDPIPGARKVDIAERMIRLIDPNIVVKKIYAQLRTQEAFEAIVTADYAFGCLDNESSRLILTELCAAYARPYLDLASDIVPVDDDAHYGGRVCVAWNGNGCPVCLGAIDLHEAQIELANPGVKRDMASIYGVNSEFLGQGGPSVVSINGVIASLAVTEFMVGITGIREPRRLVQYYGERSIATVSSDQPSSDCYYCRGIRGLGKQAGVDRYLNV